MKRSFINRKIREAMEFFEQEHFRLPPFAFFRRADWEAHRGDAKEIFDLELGWDITGFGKDDFDRFGLLLFTLRNGRAGSAEYPKPYAEKIMMVGENQVTLRHFHWHKREDIIVRGGGNLVIELFRADPARQVKIPGSGLGLSLVGAVARLHGGTLSFSDNGPGLVATFRLPTK